MVKNVLLYSLKRTVFSTRRSFYPSRGENAKSKETMIKFGGCVVNPLSWGGYTTRFDFFLCFFFCVFFVGDWSNPFLSGVKDGVAIKFKLGHDNKFHFFIFGFYCQLVFCLFQKCQFDCTNYQSTWHAWVLMRKEELFQRVRMGILMYKLTVFLVLSNSKPPWSHRRLGS